MAGLVDGEDCERRRKIPSRRDRGGGVTADEIGTVLIDHFERAMPVIKVDSAVQESQATKEMKATAEPVKQYPTLPIQFVWCDGVLYPVNESRPRAFSGVSVEQIGAVLYVRGE